MDGFNLIATAPFGLEAVVKREVVNLGIDTVTAHNGYVEYEGDALLLAQSNLWLRSADRVLIKMGEFRAETFDELFEGTKALPWGELLPANAAFPVEGRSVKSTLSSVPACQRIVKKAIVESLRDAHGVLELPEDGPLYSIEVSIQSDTAILTIDSSGLGLNKRGYRSINARAPIKETLAAALVQLSRWLPHRPFADPLCGSGTIAIEAAMIGQNMAPGLQRGFAAEQWAWIPERTWADARSHAKSLIRPLEQPVLASDIDEGVVQLARENARKAGVSDSIVFNTRDIRQFRPEEPYGCIVTNPPYGERLGTEDEVEALYRTMGRVKKGMETWSWFVITSHPQFEKLFGNKADKKRKLYNGRIQTNLYQYLGPLPPRS